MDDLSTADQQALIRRLKAELADAEEQAAEWKRKFVELIEHIDRRP